MKNILLLFLLFCVESLSAQLHPEWVKSFEDIIGEEYISVAVKDASDNFYIGGNFKTTLMSGQKLESYNNTTDGFLAKYNADLELIWVKRFGGEEGDYVFDITLYNGEIYLSGKIIGTANFNTPHQSGSNELTAEGEASFIAKYDSLGNFIWSKIVYGAESIYKIKVNEEGIFLGGSVFNDNATLETAPNIGTELNSQGRDGFVARYDLNGSLQWKILMGGVAEDNLWDMTIHEHSLYIIGTYSEAFSLSGFQTQANLLSSPGVFETFVLKINTLGEYQWAKRMPGTNIYKNRYIQAIDGSLYIGGIFEGTVNFNNPSTPGTNELSSIGSRDLYVASFDTLGVFSWAKRFGSTSHDEINTFKAEGDRIYLTGGVSFGSAGGTLNLSSPYVAGKDEIPANYKFLAAYTTQGTLISAQAFGSFSTSSKGLICDQDDVFLFGEYKDSISFSKPGIPGQQTLVEPGTNMYMAKYRLDLLPAWQAKAGIDAPTVEQSAIDVAYDDEGNSYVTGYFTLYVTFGDLPSVYGRGLRDMFVTKYDRDGKAVWCKRGGGTGNDQGNSIAVVDGWVYVTGSFESVGNFSNPYNAGTLEISSAGGKDVFLARYRASDGVLFLITRGGGLGDDEGNDLHVLDSDLYLSGSFSGIANFNKPSAFGSNELVSAGSTDAFLAKYSTFGQLDWLRRMGGTGADEGTAVVAAGSAVYVGGNFESTANFNTPSASGNELISAGEKDVFLARFSSGGNLGWARRAGGTLTDQLFDLDFENNILYSTGFFEDEAFFPGPVNTGTSLISAGGRDVFLSTYNSSGIPQWKKRAGGTANDVGTAVSVKGDKLFLSGVFRNSINFNTPSSSSGSDLSADGLRDIFVAEYDLLGALQEVKRAGGKGDDLVQGMKYDGFNVFTAGSFTQKINFNTPTDSTFNELEGAGIPFIYANRFVKRPEIIQNKAEGTLGNSVLEVNFVKPDAQGNVYFIGNTRNTIVLGSDTLTGPLDTYYYFMAKMDAFGKISMGKILFLLDGQEINDLTILGNKIAITGRFRVSISFNYPEDLQSNSLFSQQNSYDAFIAIYDTEGLFQWAKRAGGSGDDDEGVSLCHDGSNIFMSGTFKDTLNFNTPYSNAQNLIISEGYQDAFVVKYDPTGQVLWYKRFGGKDYTDDPACQYFGGQVYLSGIFSDSLNFNTPSSWSTAKLISPSTYSTPFLASLDANNGNYLWSQTMGVNLEYYLNYEDFMVNSNGIFGLSYTYKGDVNFSKPYAAGQNVIPEGPGDAVMLSKFDLNGNYLWARRMGGDVDGTIQNPKIAQNDTEILVAGEFTENINFNTPYAAGSNEIFTNSYYRQIFISAFDQNGNLNWIDDIGSTKSDDLMGICVQGNELFMTGELESKDDLKLGDLTFPDINENIHLAKFSPCSQTRIAGSTAQDINTGKFAIAAHESNGSIEASNKISGDAEANFYAPDILLKPGFEAQPGVVFKAEPGGCN